MKHRLPFHSGHGLVLPHPYRTRRHHCCLPQQGLSSVRRVGHVPLTEDKALQPARRALGCQSLAVTVFVRGAAKLVSVPAIEAPSSRLKNSVSRVANSECGTTVA
jgi:hypothetical protein